MGFHAFLSEPQDDQELEMALWLENAQPGDPLLLQVLVERYAQDIHRFCLAVENYHHSQIHKSKKAYFVTQHVFSTAVDNIESFRGYESVRSWLFWLALETTHKIQNKSIKIQKG